MRISDWSSDVCSSDLQLEIREVALAHHIERQEHDLHLLPQLAEVLPGDDHHALGPAIGAHGLGARNLRDEPAHDDGRRSEEHTSELQSLMRISYAVFCLKKKQK